MHTRTHWKEMCWSEQEFPVKKQYTECKRKVKQVIEESKRREDEDWMTTE